jgi:hypothetical protein
MWIYSILTFVQVFLFWNLPIERWIVEVHAGKDDCLYEWILANKLDDNALILKKLPISNWYIVHVPNHIAKELKQLPCIQSMFIDQRLESRNTIPDDPGFANQTNMSLIGMPAAWDISTGGFTAHGDTIVIAVIDDGFQVNHEDLAGNFWHNPQEIKGDKIDNDLNGYIDDYFGLNVFSGTDNHPILSHGTSVSGIIGAIGNNAIGISGVNWHIKIMPVSYNHYISELIEAYQYVIDMRRRYNETKGKEGAFVVAVNLSSGLDFALPEHFPLWCSMYDSLGAQGILGVCSAPNFSHNVDEDGDLPSRCTSPYTIVVTNVNSEDLLVSNSGFGRISVDLGAPGENSLTTDISSNYTFFRGTSAAAPHVAGTIALLYTVLCPSVLDSMDQNPGNVALRIKNIILSTAFPNKSLEGITLSGKRLQTNAALQYAVNECEGRHQQKLLIRFIIPNPSASTGIKIYFEVIGRNQNDIQVELYSINGVKIYNSFLSQDDLDQGYFVFPEIALPSNIYLVSLMMDKEVQTAKLFVY